LSPVNYWKNSVVGNIGPLNTGLAQFLSCLGAEFLGQLLISEPDFKLLGSVEKKNIAIKLNRFLNDIQKPD
jgi:hypothetical protein